MCISFAELSSGERTMMIVSASNIGRGLCWRTSIAAQNHAGKALMAMSTDLVRELVGKVDAAADFGKAGCCGSGIVTCPGSIGQTPRVKISGAIGASVGTRHMNTFNVES